MSSNAVERIIAQNDNRIPALRAIKYRNMRGDLFTFFRGSSHLFYEDWPAGCLLDSVPLTWVCGDLHLENFGTYKGSNRLVYFDINDFDEAALAPCSWDVTRFVTSLILAGDVLQLQENSSEHLSKLFLETYFSTLANGNSHSVERANAKGLIKKLMLSLKSRKRPNFLDKHSLKIKTIRQFKLNKSRYLPVSEQERKQVTEIVSVLAQRDNNSDFYRIHDIAFRIAGTGSLGISRYAVLIEGRGFSEGNFILDVKEERLSALTPFLTAPQPDWESQAGRAVAIQKRFQAVHPAMLTTVKTGNKAYIIRELQPTEDRITLADWAGKISHIEKLTATLAEILAWDELRSAGREGSAIADELIALGQKTALINEITSYAKMYAKQVQHDFKLFSSAYDADKLG